MPHAARLADLFQQEFHLMTAYIKGDGGILEVKYEGEVVWSNRTNRGVKPTNEEARDALHAFLNQH